MGHLYITDSTGTLWSHQYLPNQSRSFQIQVKFNHLYTKDVEANVDKAAAQFDKFLGREEAESPLGKVGGLDPAKYIKVLNSPAGKSAQQVVSTGTLLLAVVAFFGGTGTFAAITKALAPTVRGTTSFDSWITYFGAFLATLPWSVSFAVLVWMIFTGQFKTGGYTALAVWLAGSVVATCVVTAIGIATGPSLEVILAAFDKAGGAPTARAFALIEVYFDFFGGVPFLGGAITGGGVGWWVMQQTHPDALKS